MEHSTAGVALVQQAIDAVVDEALEEGRVVGAVVLVQHHGEPLYARAAGHADRETGILMALDTVFRWASLTKPVVAATALALIERAGSIWMLRSHGSCPTSDRDCSTAACRR